MPVLVPGNRLALLESGAEYFPALERAIDGARDEIYLETYIFEDDDTGRRIGAALERAARRGAAVQLLVDGFGSKDLSRALVDRMRAAGVVVLRFRPDISPWTLQTRRLRRMHRKLCVVDRRTGFIGGINIVDDTRHPDAVIPRYDYAVRVEGPVVADMHTATKRLWTLVKWVQLRRRRVVLDRPLAPPTVIGSQAAALVVRDSLRNRRAIEHTYLAAIAQAREEIIIASAYFFPGLDFRHALIAAVRRGVRVVLLLQGQVDYFLMFHASRALYGTLLDAGIEIHEYTRSHLHAKVAVIDGCWATVGSSNIDPFSLLLAREGNLVIEDRDFAHALRASLQAAIATGARRIEPLHWKALALPQRALTWACYQVVRVTSGLFAYGRGDETKQ